MFEKGGFRLRRRNLETSSPEGSKNSRRANAMKKIEEQHKIML
jgi:hypothetical protein